MEKHNLLKKLSLGIASLALICPLALGQCKANADTTNQNQSTSYINKTTNNQNSKAINVSNPETKSENNNPELQLGARHHKNANVKNRKNTRKRNTRKVRGRKYNTKRYRHHNKKNLKNLKKHRKGLYSKLRNKKRTKRIRRNRGRKKYRRVKRNHRSKRNRNYRRKSHKRMNRKHNARHMKSTNKRRNRKPVVHKHVNVKNNSSKDKDIVYDPVVGKFSTHDGSPLYNAGYTEWLTNSKYPKDVINTLHLNKYDLAYCTNNADAQFEDNESGRTPVDVESPNSPVWYLRSRAELNADRNPLRNWSQAQFNKYYDLIATNALNQANNDPKTAMFRWLDLATMYSEADPNAQQAVDMADFTWNN